MTATVFRNVGEKTGRPPGGYEMAPPGNVSAERDGGKNIVLEGLSCASGTAPCCRTPIPSGVSFSFFYVWLSFRFLQFRGKINLLRKYGAYK